MTVAALVEQANRFSSASIEFAEGISHASSGERLGRIMKASMHEHAHAYRMVRVAVEGQIASLGGAGQSLGLFMFAADMATTAAIAGDHLDNGDRIQLRRLWNDLLAREAINAVA
jgi:hypothetical protein